MNHYGTKHFAFFACLALAFILTGCDVFGSEDSEAFTASGTIVNTTDRGVQDATVTFSQGDEDLQSVTTDEEGTYTASGLEGGDYTVQVSATGYDELTFEVTIDSDRTLDDELLTGSANVQGTVVDAQTGEAIEGAEVSFAFESDTSRAAADLITTTDGEGVYTISDAPLGTFLLVVRVAGFFNQVVPEVPFEEGENTVSPSAPSPELAEGEFRVVLTWGESPSDLDSHLTGPDGSGDRFHVYFGNQTPSGAGANLDVDDISSYGPETTTITALRDGLYRYSVHNFSTQSADGALEIESSPARIELYDDSGSIATYSPPAASEGDGNTWRVFEINVADGTPSLNDEGGDTFGYYEASSWTDVTTFVTSNKDVTATPTAQQSLKQTFDQAVAPR